MDEKIITNSTDSPPLVLAPKLPKSRKLISTVRAVLKLSIFTVPAAILFTLCIDAFMGTILGGLATRIGFPITYYHDVYKTPEIDYDVPLLRYVNVLIVYIGLTIVSWTFTKGVKWLNTE